MPLKAVTFDCAQTLVDVSWNPVEIALKASEASGLALDHQIAGEQYARLLFGRQTACFLASQKGEQEYDAWWRQLTVDWLQAMGVDLMYAEEIIFQANKLIYQKGDDGATSIFRPYPDAEELIRDLRQQGLKLAIISNWDYSLHRVVRLFGWADLFEVVIPSHEFGVEKPDPSIFIHALKCLNVEPDEALHVGDDPIADGQGARKVGMHTFLVDHAAHGFQGLTERLRELT